MSEKKMSDQMPWIDFMRANQKHVFKILLGVTFIMSQVLHVTAQVRQPVKWHFSAVPVGSEASLIFTASLAEGWHIYSQFIGKDGPLPTAVTFVPSNDYTLVGKVNEESTPTKSYDETFMMDIVWFSNTALFSQQVKLHSPSTIVRGKIQFMLCTDEICLPPGEVEFAIGVRVDKPPKKNESDLN